MPPCVSASMRLLYESFSSTYLPTTATRAAVRGDFTRRTTSSHRERSIGRASRVSSLSTISSRPSRWNTSGTSYTVSTSLAVMTASSSTSQNRAILDLIPGGR